jgi:thiol-disulfide isomerase/thioredoxin
MSKKIRQEYALPALKSIDEYYSKKEKIYSINASKLRELILESKHTNILIAFTANWCSPCHKSMPKIKSLLEENKDKLKIVFISSIDWLEVNRDRLFIDKYGFDDQALLCIDLYEYGTEYMNWKRMSRFINELTPDYSGEISLPSYLLFNNKGKLVSHYHSNINVNSVKLK